MPQAPKNRIVVSNPRLLWADPVGQCIYCGAREYDPKRPSRPLSTEHAIPESLRGVLLLPEASCCACEGVTSAFEGAVARKVFGPLRIHYDLPTKRRKERPTTLPINVQKCGVTSQVELSIERHPMMCAFMEMSPPTLLGPDNGGDRKVVVVYPAGIEPTNRAMSTLNRMYAADRVKITANAASREDLGLLLAKIAHCLTVIRFGVGGFEPFLVNLIRQKDGKGLRQYVGGSIHGANMEPRVLHMTHPRYFHRGRQKLIVWSIQLFSNFDFPTYDVVAGRTYDNVPECPRVGEMLHAEDIDGEVVC